MKKNILCIFACSPDFQLNDHIPILLCCYFWVRHPPLYVTFSIRPFVAHHIPGTVHHVIVCKMMISLCFLLCFLVFFKVLIFLVIRGIKGQKITQNEKKKLHPSRAVSQEQCSIWSWFLVRLRKMMKPPGIFFIFFKI